MPLPRSDPSHPPQTFEHRSIRNDKPVLRLLYDDYRRRIETHLSEGPTLEIGAGSGSLNMPFADVISMDVQQLPWLDVVADAHYLPFRQGYFSNIVMIDVFHHLEAPSLFLEEAGRLLGPGGRLVLIEPAITPISWIVYNFLHPEPLILGEDPLANRTTTPGRGPFDSNQAVPTILFGRKRDDFVRAFPAFKLLKNSRFAIASYLLSGGFRRWSLLPYALAPVLLRAERRLDKILGFLMAFRMLVVIEKTEDVPNAPNAKAHS